jgi:hypothetical protein
MSTTQERIECSDGPVSTMPGHQERLYPLYGGVHGIMCENHDEVQASHRVQGETDSMGCEYHYFCASCADAARAADAEQKDGYCDLHNGEGSDIRNWRDYDEGMSGPIYRACRLCRDRANAAAAEEARRYENDDIGYWDDDSGRVDTYVSDEDVQVENYAPMMISHRNSRTSRVKRASKRLMKKARKIALQQIHLMDDLYQGPTIRACIRHLHYFGEY